MKKIIAAILITSCPTLAKSGSFFNTPLFLSESEPISNLYKIAKQQSSPIRAELPKQAQKPTQLLAKSTPSPKAKSFDEKQDDDLYSSLRMLAEVIDLGDRRAFRKINFKKFIEEALTAAVPYFDAHSAFFSSKSYLETKESTSGKFSGIGITVMSKSTDSDELLVTDVSEDGPSQKAGLESGDKIIKIDDTKLRGLSSDEVINKLRGIINTKVQLKVIRDKKLLEFEVKREMIKNQVTTSYFLEDQNIHYLSLRLFTENAAKSVKDIIDKVDKNTKGIILDLRNNPGGILESAIETAALFLDKGSLVAATKNRDGKTVAEYKTTTKPIFDKNLPIFALVDNFTASAAEILAGVLKHYSEQKDNHKKLMVFILGSQTFGKGSVQEVIPISNGCALKLTTMLYYLPGDVSIQAAGITPDFVINPRIIPEHELKLMKELSGREGTLKNHIERNEATKSVAKNSPPTKSVEKELSWDEKFKKKLLKDIHVQKAVSMISLITMAKNHTPKKVDTREKAIAFLNQSLISDDNMSVEKTS